MFTFHICYHLRLILPDNSLGSGLFFYFNAFMFSTREIQKALNLMFYFHLKPGFISSNLITSFPIS